MEEKYKKFLEFDWVNSAEWQLYYTNLYPTPPGTKIEHFKKKFYKLKIDPDFDITYKIPEQTSQNTYQNTPRQNTSSTMPTTGGSNSPNLAMGEALLWFLFLFSIVIQFHTLKIAAIALLLRVFRRVGTPKFSMEYAQVVFIDEHFQQLLYALLFMIDSLNFFTLVPLGLTAIMNISEICKLKEALFKPIIPYCNKIINKRVEIAGMRANVEVAIGFLLVLGIPLGMNMFLLPIFYWQYIRFKYIVNEDTKGAFRKLNVFMNSIKNKPSTPGLLKMAITKIQEFSSYMGRTEAAPGQGAGGANCIIF